MATEHEQIPSHFERWRRATLAPFEHRAFALFWCGSLVSSFGGMIQTVGASWLMTTIAPSADQVALVQTAGALPFFFLSLIAGALADTRDRRTIMLVSQFFTLMASVVLAAITLAGAITPSLLLLLTFLVGCGAAALRLRGRRRSAISCRAPRSPRPSWPMPSASTWPAASARRSAV